MNRLLSLSIALVALTTGCGGGGDGATTAPPAPVATVNVALSAATLIAGANGSATASLTDASGKTLAGRTITWNSSAGNVATVDVAGNIVAVSPGTASITATSEGRTGSAQLTVIPPPVATVTVTASATSIAAGNTTTASVVLRDAAGNALSGRAVSWASSAPAVATVDASGVITGISAGSALINATSEGRSGAVSITVTPAPVATVGVTLSSTTVAVGDGASATALLRDARGNALAGRLVAWSTSNPAVATVNGTGTITTIAPGTALITAASEGQVGSAQLTVVPPPVATVSVVVASSVSAGSTANASAVLRDANGNVLTGRVVSWVSSAPAVATVNAVGVVTGVALGTSTITATSEDKVGTATITVTAPPITSVVITGSQRVKAGDSYTFSVTARLANGTIVNRPVSWSIREPARGVMTASGILTPTQTGAITLQATIDGSLWEGSTTAYDWENQSISGSEYISLEADNTITNKFGSSEYAELVFVCSREGYFFAWVSTRRFVTQNGLVTMSFDGAPSFSQVWNESSDFSTLSRPGSNLTVKTFAQQVAAARTFGFAFTEFQSSAKAMIFRVTGSPAKLAPLLARCPSNTLVRAPGNDAALGAELLRSALSAPVEPSELLRAQRELRAARGAQSSAAPALPHASLTAPMNQAARRRP